MPHGLDTLAMVAATLGTADRLWLRWRAFDQRVPRDRFIPVRAYQEFLGVVEGIGGRGVGILEEFVRDCGLVIRTAGASPPGSHTLPEYSGS